MKLYPSAVRWRQDIEASEDSTNTVSHQDVSVSLFFTKRDSCCWFWPLNHCLWLLSVPTQESISLLGLQTGNNSMYNIRSGNSACTCGPCLRAQPKPARRQLILSEIHISKVCVECRRVFIFCHFCTLIIAHGCATGGTLGSNQEEQSGRWCARSSLVFSLLQTKTTFAHNYKYLLNYNLTSIWLLSSK